MSRPPQRSRYILYCLAITVNDGFLPRLCHIIGLSFTRETASPGRPPWAIADIVDTAPVGSAAVIAGAPQLTVRVWRSWLTWWRRPPASPISPSGECCAFWMDWLSSATCQPTTCLGLVSGFQPPPVKRGITRVAKFSRLRRIFRCGMPPWANSTSRHSRLHTSRNS